MVRTSGVPKFRVNMVHTVMYHKPCTGHRDLQGIYKQMQYIGLDKSGYQVNIFLISPQKPMLWIFIRSALARHF